MSRKRAHILALFLDGIGLGLDDQSSNPFAVANMPALRALANGNRWLANTSKQISDNSIFIPTEVRMGVEGRPQSGTGQASLLTGINVPKLIGKHYGPKPNSETRQLIAEHSYFKRLLDRGQTARLLTAYPPRLLHDFDRGKTLRSSNQQAAYESGLGHFTVQDVIDRRALTAEWTTDSWRRYLQIPDLPEYSARQAGQLLAQLSRQYDFAFHSHWLTDHVGHRGPFARGVKLLETFDDVIAGVLDIWDYDEGLVIVVSDHGNMEDLSNRHHTLNDVPTLVIGNQAGEFADGYRALTDFVPGCDRILAANEPSCW